MSYCKVIALTNQKGGVGKTTTAVNLGVGLAKQGKRVLLIDADAQANLTMALGYSRPDDLPITLSTIMQNIIDDKSFDVSQGILSHSEGVALLPSNIELSGFEVRLINAMSRERVLKTYVNEVKKNYDYVLIDCMPSLGMITINALAAADSVVKHTVKVVVSDGQGGTATRTWTFTRTNSAPTISGSDGNLGDKNLGFTYAYTIDDADGDTLTVVEELNDETIRTINNAPKGEELTVTITSEKLYALGLNSVNTLKITVTDGKGGTAYRRVTFKRTNSAPTISGQDKALGLKNGSFAENYTVSDVEGDNVVVTEFVDDVQIRSYQATLGQQETIELTREKWLSLTNGQHQLRIEAVDGNFATSVRVFSFSKKETVIKFELVAPEETDAAATKVLVTPTWKIEGAVAKVEACNNGFDAVPTWEDITAMVQINRVYNFTNKTKTASKWGVNIRFTITKNEGFEGEVSISGFGGAYE